MSEKWITGDEKDGLPVMIRWRVTNGFQRFNLFSYEEQVELKALLNQMEARAAALDEAKRALEFMVDHANVVDYEGTAQHALARIAEIEGS